MDFTTLSKNLAEVQLGSARMTDVATGTYAIHIDGDKVALVSETNQKIPVSLPSLAAMRIVADAAKAATAKNTREARDNADYSNLQKAITLEGKSLNEKTRFTVVHRLQIQDVVNDLPIYRNECYKGYPEYVKASRKAAGMPNASVEQTSARNAAFTEASEELRKTGVKSGITADAKNLLLMPVFTVSEK